MYSFLIQTNGVADEGTKNLFRQRLILMFLFDSFLYGAITTIIAVF